MSVNYGMRHDQTAIRTEVLCGRGKGVECGELRSNEKTAL